MTDHSNDKQYIKGVLTSEFGRTSIGTTPQDEKNILLETPDGDSMYTARRDTYAYTVNKRSKRERLDRKNRSSWQHILFMINQLHKSITADLGLISDILDDMRLLSEEILETINNLGSQIETIQRDHEFVIGILDQSGKIGLSQHQNDPDIITLLNRYSERTGKEISPSDDLTILILAQMANEQSITLPELQHKLEQAGILYDEAIMTTQHISVENDQLQDRYKDIASSPNSEQKAQELEDIQNETSRLKKRCDTKRNELKNRLGQLRQENNYNSENASLKTHDERTKSFDHQSFGLKTPSPKAPYPY